MIIITLAIVLASAIVAVWYKEARIFVALFQKLCFKGRSGPVFFSDRLTAFPQSARLESNAQMICDEYLAVVRQGAHVPRLHEVDSANYKISFNDGPAWKMIVLKGFDAWFYDNCALFPNTTRLLRQMPCVSSAMFSILEPGVHIPPHRGKFNGILRYHLALMTPKSGDCFIEVAGQQYHWKEREGVLFNDVYRHSVTNNSGEHRIVLFIDVKKPAAGWINAINTALLKVAHNSPGFRKATANGSLKFD